MQFERSATSVFGNDESSFNIVVLGPTGCGKSTIINQLFNRTVCTTSASASSVTQELKFFHGNLMTSENAFKKTTVIDTIGKFRSYKQIIIWSMVLNNYECQRCLNLTIWFVNGNHLPTCNIFVISQLNLTLEQTKFLENHPLNLMTSASCQI